MTRSARLEFPLTVKRDAAHRAQGKCESCSRKLMAGDFLYDHIVPAALGGEPTLANCQCLCRACHRQKTTHTDIKAISKSKRIADKAMNIKRARGRPLPGTVASGWRKRMDGSVERR